jgi:hypothetical protein
VRRYDSRGTASQAGSFDAEHTICKPVEATAESEKLCLIAEVNEQIELKRVGYSLAWVEEKRMKQAAITCLQVLPSLVDVPSDP